MTEWYQKATLIPFCQLLTDLTPKTIDSLRYYSNNGSLPTNFFYQLKQRQNIWMMISQKVFALLIIQKISVSFRKKFILNCPKDFIQFLSECLVKFSRGEFQDFQKNNAQKYRKQVSELTQKQHLYKKEELI